MDPQDVLIKLRKKVKQCEKLKRKKQRMLASQKLVHDFMRFIEAIDKKDAENVQKLAEKAVMGAILNMMNGGNNSGFAADDAKKEA